MKREQITEFQPGFSDYVEPISSFTKIKWGGGGEPLGVLILSKRVCLFSVSNKQFPTHLRQSTQISLLIIIGKHCYSSIYQLQLELLIHFLKKETISSPTLSVIQPNIFNLSRITHLITLTCIHQREPTVDRVLCNKCCAMCFIFS